ncbi:cytochrome P450 [Syncephalastrum racemosum]|uniref:Cytochrome P450 n=1 Tax=Syncephalastrum racemosum TaxID=13706 RepID=A0A1X2HQ99_SYNRA|nr:cytochrome P450 [Syncephalastrum racemosum]
MFRPPAGLPKLPIINYFRLLWALYRKESPTRRSQRLILPALQKHNAKAYLAKVPYTWTVYLVDPVAVKTFLMRNGTFPKTMESIDAFDQSHPNVQFWGRENLGFSVGDSWKRQRKIIFPAFRRAMPVQLFGELVPKMFDLIDKEHSTIAIDLMQRFTLDALGLAAFSFDFHALDNHNNEWEVAYEMIRKELVSPLTNMLARYDYILKYIIPGRAEKQAAVSKINHLLSDIANERRKMIKRNPDMLKVPDSEKDLLTLMLESDLENSDDPASEELIRANLATFFLAGHDTTANTLSFWLYHLAMYKDIQKKAREEVIETMGGAPEDIVPTAEQLKKMKYMDCIIKENLRFMGPALELFPRIAKEDYNLNGIFIPKGTRVSVDLHTLHHHPDVWKEPERFDPLRFVENGEHSKHEGLSWIAFSSGARVCIGQNFSLVEQRVVMSMLLRRYEWDIPEDSIHREGLQLKDTNNQAPRSLEIVFKKRY